MTIDNMGNEFDQALLKILREGRRITVSYTHLTLPTSG